MWKSKFYGAFVRNHRVDFQAINATPRAGIADSLVDFYTGADGLELVRASQELDDFLQFELRLITTSNILEGDTCAVVVETA